MVEASLIIWRLSDRLDDLPAGERGAYVNTCIRRAVWRVLRRELRQRPPAGGEGTAPDQWEGVSEEGSEAWCDRIADDLLELVSSAALIAALNALAPHEYQVVNLFYGQDLTDREIADRLSDEVATVRKRRNRAIMKLRKQIRMARSP